jgi:hypothetical protein
VAAYELVDYESAHRQAYLDLLREAWGPGSMTPAEFEWWFDRNPTGSLRSVAVADGRIVGVAAHSLYRVVLEGEERVASFSVHATTHASARGQGIFVALEAKHEREATERGVAVVLAFASAPTAPLFLGPLGWSEIARLRVWGRPLVGGARGGGAQPAPRDDAAAAWPNHVVRDARFLAWRYLDSPRGYRAVERSGGYAVVGRTTRRGVRAGVIVDLVAGADVRGLLRAAVAAADGRLLLALPAPEHRAAYASLGFAPLPYTLHFMGKALAGTLAQAPSAWRFTLGDTDFF